MSILFDTLKFQNENHEGRHRQKPIVAEIGVIVNNLPTYAPSKGADGEWSDNELPTRVKPGYYYVAMISTFNETNGVWMEDWGKRYFVSKESIFEYVYGYSNEEDPPEYIECYDRIADAVDSDFLDFFLLMNRLIHESRDDRARINSERRESKHNSLIDTTIQIDRVDNLMIMSRSVISQRPYRELRYEIMVDEGHNRGEALFDGTIVHVLPFCSFKICGKNDKVLNEYMSLDDTIGTVCFSDFVRLAKATEERLVAYFTEDAAKLTQRFTDDEIKSLKVGILGRALGMREYL